MTAYEVYYETLRKDYPTLKVGCFIKKPIEIEDLSKGDQGRIGVLKNMKGKRQFVRELLVTRA